jgi:hypothetical protein
MSEIKPGNTFYDATTGNRTTLGGAISIAVNETANLLYVASVNGTVGVFALDPPTAPAAFSVNGVIRNPQGVPAAGQCELAGGGDSVVADHGDERGRARVAQVPPGHGLG